LQTFDSNTLTTTHRLTGQGKLISFFQLQNTAARETDHNVNLVNRSVNNATDHTNLLMRESDCAELMAE